VQQPFSSGNDDFFVEEALKNRFRQKIAYRQQSHALMMGHPTINQFRGTGVGGSGLFKIRRFVKSVWPEPSRSFHLSQIFHRCGGIDVERQNGGIRRYNGAVFYFYLQREWRDPVSMIVIVTRVIFCARCRRLPKFPREYSAAQQIFFGTQRLHACCFRAKWPDTSSSR
jgi:hypothetical protein